MIRPEIFKMRLSKNERGLIRRLAEQEGMNSSEFIRQAIREAAKARGIPSPAMADLFVSLEDAKNAKSK